jgi:MFS family permease
MDASLIRRAKADGKVGDDLLGGVRYIGGNRAPKAIILLVSLSALLAMPYHVLVPVFAKETLGGGAGTYGVLMSAAGVGAVLGSLFSASGWAVRRKGSALTAGSLSFPLLLLAFSFSRDYALSVGLLAALGFAFVLQSAPANSLLQAIVPDPLRGRVMAIYVSLFLGLMRAGSLLLGLLAAATSATAALAAAAVASLIGGAAICAKFPELRRME